MDKNSTKYTFVFALIVCVICSLALALVSEGLREPRERNEEYDVKKNILSAVKLRGARKEVAMQDMMRLYERLIEEIVIDEEGNIVEGKKPKDMAEAEKQHPLYIYQEEGKVVSYAFPVYGKGLWSTIYGFLGLEADGMTIRGIVFYKHGETPGLGGEIETAWFQKNFEGKKVYDIDRQEVRPVKVIKGKVSDLLSGRDAEFAVDGITGATMTSKGVSEFLDHWIRKYEPYFSKVRKGHNDTTTQ